MKTREELARLAHECDLLARAEAAAEVLARSSSLSRFDEEALRRGLQLARDAYQKLESFSHAHDGDVSPEVRQAMQALARLTLRSYPVLLHACARSQGRTIH